MKLDIDRIEFTSDLHIGHEAAAKWRGFKSVSNMNDCILSNLSDRLDYKKILIVLGDVAFGDKDEALILLKKIPGRKILIYGNHDNHKIKSWNIWEEVVAYKEIRGEGKSLCLFHYPMEDWNSKGHGSIHLHGHEHGSIPDYKNRIDVGVDNPKWKFKPASLEAIMEEVKNLPLHEAVGHHRYKG